VDEGNVRSIYINSCEMPIRAKLATKRRDQLPLLEIGGSEEFLTIPDKAGLLEPMHFIIFPDNVAGFEFNFFAPRPTGLRSYILNKAINKVDEVILTPLIRHDINELIANIGEIKVFTFKAGRENAEIISELDKNLANAFKVLSDIGEAKEFEIILRNTPNSKKYFHLDLLNKLALWLQNPTARASVDTLKIKAIDKCTNESRDFDLLNEYIYSKLSVIKHDDIHKVIDSESMYNGIIEAYNQLNPDILQSLERINDV